MNINVLKNRRNIRYVENSGGLVIEQYNDASDDETYKLSFFNPKNNTITEIAPALHKTSNVKIQNAVWKSIDHYFAVLTKENDKSSIDIYRFSSKTRTYDIYYSFSVPKDIDGKNCQIKVFILSANSLLIQTETIDLTNRDDLMGQIIFDQKIINTETLEMTDIKDENIRNNGISMIKAISPIQLMIKTGYSYIEDERLKEGSEYEALIESIFIHTTSKFIADLTIQSETIDAELINSTYFNKYILSADYKDGFIFYTLYEPEKNEAESIFYDLNSSETFTCKIDDFDIEDLNINYVISGVPYVKNTALAETSFLNLRSMEFDLSAMGMEPVCILKNLILLKNIDKKGRSTIRFFHYPDMKQVDEEKGKNAIGCYRNNEYYIYIQE